MRIFGKKLLLPLLGAAMYTGAAAFLGYAFAHPEISTPLPMAAAWALYIAYAVIMAGAVAGGCAMLFRRKTPGSRRHKYGALIYLAGILMFLLLLLAILLPMVISAFTSFAGLPAGVFVAAVACGFAAAPVLLWLGALLSV